jgi:hypothetical protein
MDTKVEEIRKQLIELGKEVAESHSTTQFPDWAHFKIGLHKIQGVPFEPNYWISRTADTGESDSNE